MRQRQLVAPRVDKTGMNASEEAAHAFCCHRGTLAVLPCSAPLMMAVGAPIPVPHIAPGSKGFDEAVQVAHEQLVRALVELYDKYKVRC